jgi:N-acyl-D-amino-acid deacylase
MHCRCFAFLIVFISFASSPTPVISQVHQQDSAPKVDLLIRGGVVLDGAGAEPVQADIGVREDRIVFIGDSRKQRVESSRVIDATGLVVSPGFIDPHTHADADLLDPVRRSNLNYLMQGVTTVIVGNDGGGTPHPGKIFETWQKQGIGTNAAMLVGHGAVRREVLGNIDVQPTPEQLEKMRALVRGAMDEGAIGLSSGLFYVPGSFARTEEVIELSKVAAERDGYYDTHMRDESAYSIGLLGSIEETIRIGRDAHIPVHISHIKALGPQVWGKSTDAIAMIKKAQSEGIKVTADQYPYEASGSSLDAALIPHDVQILPLEQLGRLSSDKDRRAKVLNEVAENLEHRGGAERLLFTSKEAPELHGRTLAQVATGRKESPVEAALDLFVEMRQKKKAGALAVASFNMSERDIENFMRQDWVMTGSDGSPGHPRKYGTFPRKIRVYALDRKIITLPFAIHSSSALTAESLHLEQRGLLLAGYFADIIAFDPKNITDQATYDNPEVFSAGMKYVVVNGKLAVDGGKFTNTFAGRALRLSHRVAQR